ncbi:MAG: hypothetical protein R6V01_03630 [Thermoplasmatota archaeon]
MSMTNYINRIGNDDTIGENEEKSTMRTVPQLDGRGIPAIAEDGNSRSKEIYMIKRISNEGEKSENYHEIRFETKQKRKK